MMRIIVSGGHGQVGRALEQIGKVEGLDLIVLGRDVLDITDMDSIRATFGKYDPDIFINAAAYTAVDKAESEPDAAFRLNEKSLVMLADACNQLDIPFMHLSTDYVFDGIKDGLYGEDDKVNPVSIYGKSKELGERVIRHKLKRYIIMRTSWVFGEYGNNFVKTMVRLAGEREQLSVVSDQFGGPSSASCIARSLLSIAEQYDKRGEVEWGTYHFCQQPYVSWYEFASWIIRRAHQFGVIDHEVEVIPISSSEFQTTAPRPKNSRLCTDRYESIFSRSIPDWFSDVDDILQSLKL